MSNEVRTVLVGLDDTNGTDNAVLVVGTKRVNESIKIINAFQGQEAIDIFNKLITKKEKQNELSV